MPRESIDAPLAAAASSLPLTLEQAGWHASTGPLVWNRRKKDLGSRAEKGWVRVLWAADIDGGFIHRDKGRDQYRYMRVGQKEQKTLLLSEPAILVQRTTAPEQARRLVATELTTDQLESFGGAVVVENHVNVLRPIVDSPLISRQTLARVLATTTFDRMVRCLSGSVALSSYELGALRLPSAEVLARWNELSEAELDAAVSKTYRPDPV